jgi:hypothetical protein
MTYVLYQPSWILTYVGSKKDLTTTSTEVTQENTTKKSLLLQSTTSLCLPVAGSVFLVVKSFVRRRAGQPLGRLVLRVAFGRAMLASGRYKN